jgi:hypothetical protein
MPMRLRPRRGLDGTWIGDYLSLTTAGGVIIVAWSDQRAGTPKSVVQIAVGSPSASSAPPRR